MVGRTVDEDTVCEIMGLLVEIKELTEEGAVVLVEGKRDRRALTELGIKGTIVEVSKKLSLEKLSCRKAIILTDFDEKGDELAKSLEKGLRRLGIEPVLEPRRRLRLLVGNFKEIENLMKLKTVLERAAWKD